MLDFFYFILFLGIKSHRGLLSKAVNFLLLMESEPGQDPPPEGKDNYVYHDAFLFTYFPCLRLTYILCHTIFSAFFCYVFFVHFYLLLHGLRNNKSSHTTRIRKTRTSCKSKSYESMHIFLKI